MSINEGVYAITSNVDGVLYVINDTSENLIRDWDGDCSIVPSNDAKVFFAAIDGDPVNPYLYTDFESFIQILLERELHAVNEKEEENASTLNWKTDPVWKAFHEKWGEDTVDRNMMDGETHLSFVEDLYDAYEATGFVPFFQAISGNDGYDGNRFDVVGRVPTDDPNWDLENLPAWRISFDDGNEIEAFPEEICFAKLFPYCSEELQPYLDTKLKDDPNVEVGGVSFIGETVMDFLFNLDDGVVTDLETLNLALESCGIKPVTAEVKKVTP